MHTHFSGNDWREHRLVFDKLKERTDVIDEYAGKSQAMGTTEGRMKEVRDKQSSVSLEIADTYNKRKSALESSRWGRGFNLAFGKGSKHWNGALKESRKEYEKNDLVQTLSKSMEDAATKKVDEAVAAAGGKLLKFAEASKGEILKLGKDTDRKLAIATAKGDVCEAFILDMQKEVDFLALEEQGMRELAQMLGTDVSLDDLKKATVLRDSGIALRAKIAEERAALEKQQFPDDAMPKVENVYKTLSGITTRFGDKGLFGLEDDLYAVAAGTNGANLALKNKIDKLNVPPEQKDLFKTAVDKLSSPELVKAAQVFLRTKLIERSEKVKNINEKPDAEHRLGSINESGVRNMKVNINIGGVDTAFEVCATKAKGGRFIILQGSNGQYASIDLTPDNGQYHLTYRKAEGLRAESVPFDTPPAVDPTKPADVIQLKTVVPVVTAPTPSPIVP
ncbi:MAG TPA: hypothetical protein PKV72_02740 [Candidatus Peribacteria bacterium]|nr:hypothetical protein [Candidatus Peribacteria bacterium]